MHKFQRWRANILKATTPKELAQVVLDYVACVLPSEISKLPATSQAAVVDAPSDIAGAAVTLLRDELRFAGDPETAELMHEMTQTFNAASVRLAHLHSRAVGLAEDDTAPSE